MGLLVAVFASLVASGGCSRVAFTTDGEGISNSRFAPEVERRISVIRRRNPRELEGDRGSKLVEDTKLQVATELIKAALMGEQASGLGMGIPKGEASRAMEAERTQKGADRFAGELKSQGLTEAGYLKRLEDQALVDELGRKVSADVTATGDEAESYYLTHKEIFSHTAMVHAAHILLDAEGQARIAADELKEGKDFSQVAKSISKDNATRGNGGDLGWIEQGTMEPAFEQAAFALAAGQVSGFVKASDGYHVIKVLERRDAYTPPFAEVENEAMKALLSKKREEKFSDWLRTVYANARVKVNNGIGKWDPRLGMVVK